VVVDGRAGGCSRTPALLQRTSVVMGGEIPVVIINGMAKANPTVDEVTSEFRRGK